MSDANTRRIRAARARIRAAATLLRDARGLDSMSVGTEERLLEHALGLDSLAEVLGLREREVNEHVAKWNRLRKGG